MPPYFPSDILASISNDETHGTVILTSLDPTSLNNLLDVLDREGSRVQGKRFVIHPFANLSAAPKIDSHNMIVADDNHPIDGSTLVPNDSTLVQVNSSGESRARKIADVTGKR